MVSAASSVVAVPTKSARRRRSSSSSSGSSSSSSGKRKKTYKVKEADKIIIPDFPIIVHLTAWKTSLQNNVVVASGTTSPSQWMRWVSDIWNVARRPEDLDSPSGSKYITMDMKLGSGMQTMIKNAGERQARSSAKGYRSHSPKQAGIICCPAGAWSSCSSSTSRLWTTRTLRMGGITCLKYTSRTMTSGPS